MDVRLHPLRHGRHLSEQGVDDVTSPPRSIKRRTGSEAVHAHHEIKMAIGEIRCLAPIEDRNATVLILGSMPGKASLCANQYYAHPRNLFWKMLGQIVGAKPDLPYEERTIVLQSACIALWDVLETCSRTTSLDSHIEAASATVNNFSSFYSEHPGVNRVFFNGARAAKFYRQRVLPIIGDHSITYSQLPSTSPANTGISYDRKLAAWRAVAEPS
jgi:double-stranded uracil-DNA glycosylase